MGSGDGQFLDPAGLAVDASGHVFVTDQTTDRVQKFDSDGTFILAWGSMGFGNGQFMGAVAVAVNAAGDVFVADQDNFRVQKFDSDGNFLAAFGSLGRGQGQFRALPLGLAVDAGGNVYASDDTGRVQKFDGQSGQFLAGWDHTGVTRLIATDDSGDIFIRDDNAVRPSPIFDGCHLVDKR